MKKIIYVLLFLPVIGFCQDNFNDYNEIINELKTTVKDDKKKNKVHRLEVGLNGGLNFAEIAQDVTNNDFTLDDKLGALYGGTIVYNFNRFLCIKGDFDIASKGFLMSNVEFEGTEGAVQAIKTGDVKQMINYFDIPAFFHLGFGKKLKFDINFGPYFAFLLKNRSQLVDVDGNQVALTDNAFDFSVDNLSNIDWGWVGGAGIDYHITDKISIGFDFLIEQGQKILNGGDTFGNFRNRSQDFDFGVNFLLFEKKKKKLF
jgi:hypothetical protein|tara:strand:- start:2 stop:778 length:777 start_codon:yes stop_codon:yes gene_type:complete